jgi:dTDP-glucose pyrophosphorylase
VKGVLVAGGLGEWRTRPAWQRSGLARSCVERPPVDEAIEAFARAGFQEVAVILAHSEDVLWHYLGDGARYGIVVYCVHNPFYPRGGATAVYAAQAFVGGEPFVASLSGYPVTANVLLTLAGQGIGSHAVCIDRTARAGRGGDGAMKVRLDEQGRVDEIGRRLKHWHGLCTGAFLFQPDVFGAIAELLVRGSGNCSISTLLRCLIKKGKAPKACEVSPLWEGVQDAEGMLVWTMPRLSANCAQERLLA